MVSLLAGVHMVARHFDKIRPSHMSDSHPKMDNIISESRFSSPCRRTPSRHRTRSAGPAVTSHFDHYEGGDPMAEIKAAMNELRHRGELCDGEICCGPYRYSSNTTVCVRFCVIYSLENGWKECVLCIYVNLSKLCLMLQFMSKSYFSLLGVELSQTFFSENL